MHLSCLVPAVLALLAAGDVCAATLLVDVPSGELVERFAVDQDVAHMVALTPDADRAFVANIGSGTVTVVDLGGGEEPRHLASGKGTEGVAVVREGREAWLSNRADGTLTVFDADSLEVLAQIEAPGFPIRIEPDAGRGRVYVTTPEADALRVFAVDSREQVAVLEVGNEPDGMAWSLLDVKAAGHTDISTH